MNLTRKQIKQIEKLTNLTVMYRGTHPTYTFSGTNVYNYHLNLEIDLKDKTVTYSEGYGYDMPIPIEWLRPLADILGSK